MRRESVEYCMSEDTLTTNPPCEGRIFLNFFLQMWLPGVGEVQFMSNLQFQNNMQQSFFQLTTSPGKH